MGGEHTGRAGGQAGAWAGFILALALGAATYAAWLAWDTEYYYYYYYYDDVTVAAYQGPYRSLRVVGCGLTFAVVTALLATRWRPLTVAAGTTVGFWLRVR